MHCEQFKCRVLHGGSSGETIKESLGTATNIMLKQGETLGYIDINLKSYAKLHSKLTQLLDTNSSILVLISNDELGTGAVYVIDCEGNELSVIREYIYGSLTHEISRDVMSNLLTEAFGFDCSITMLAPSLYTNKKLFIS